jgi:hypothetical protein
MYEASYPASLGNPSPTLAGANGQSDVTISSQAFYGQSAAGTAINRRNIAHRSAAIVRR